nr:MAG TPA: hypothetical protein [Caudoviricetes sp.]
MTTILPALIAPLSVALACRRIDTKQIYLLAGCPYLEPRQTTPSLTADQHRSKHACRLLRDCKPSSFPRQGNRCIFYVIEDIWGVVQHIHTLGYSLFFIEYR